MAGRDSFRLVAAAMALFPLVLGCSSADEPHRPSDLLLVGTDPCYPPFEGIDPETDATTGFDIELVSLISQANDWHYQDTTLTYDDLIPALRRGDIDLVASALPMPPDTLPDLAVSDPYYLVSRVLVLRAADSLITGLEDLPAGLIGMIAGTRLSDFSGRVRNLKTYPRQNLSRAFTELAEGTLDAMVVDFPLARAFLATRTDLRICSASLGHEYYVFAMRAADSLRLGRLNDALAGLVGGYTYELLHQKWFGYPPLNVAVPDSVSARWPAR
jgi:ABC-type amino acid transport substrate-binding protein